MCGYLRVSFNSENNMEIAVKKQLDFAFLFSVYSGDFF
jgi:hypothetical protein